jgi:hypothetical protein
MDCVAVNQEQTAGSKDFGLPTYVANQLSPIYPNHLHRIVPMLSPKGDNRACNQVFHKKSKAGNIKLDDFLFHGDPFHNIVSIIVNIYVDFRNIISYYYTIR